MVSGDPLLGHSFYGFCLGQRIKIGELYGDKNWQRIFFSFLFSSLELIVIIDDGSSPFFFSFVFVVYNRVT